MVARPYLVSVSATRLATKRADLGRSATRDQPTP
jgi:hypothetical protein